MSQIFNFRRFSEYLLTDIRRVSQRLGGFWLIIVTAAVIPLLYTLTYEFSMKCPDYNSVTLVLFFLILMVTMTALAASITSKCYGIITDRNEGGNFLMLPASALEKTISMILITGVLAPLLFLSVLLATDIICNALSADRCGYSLLYVTNHLYIMDSTDAATFSYTKYKALFHLLPVFVLWDLMFLAAALLLKKAKAAVGLLMLCASLIRPWSILRIRNASSQPIFCPEEMIGRYTTHSSISSVNTEALIAIAVMCVILYIIVKNKQH